MWKFVLLLENSILLIYYRKKLANLLKKVHSISIEKIEKVKGNFTARPRKLKYGDGEILLKNLTREQCEEVEYKLTDRREPVFDEEKEEYVLVEPEKELVVAAMPDLNKVSLSLERNEEFEIVEVNYCSTTGQARVGKRIKVGKNPIHAHNEFRVKIAKTFM